MSFLIAFLAIFMGFSPIFAGVTRIKAPHPVVILNSGIRSLDFRIEMIERAQKSIELETFIFRDDEAGRVLLHALIEKAKEGVKVRLLIDNLMNEEYFGPFVAHELKRYGIEVRYFNTTPLIHAVRMQYRNHRKSLVVDGKEAIIGGRNIGNEYFDLSSEYNFLDRDLWVAGAVVKNIVKAFDQGWKAPQSERVSRPKRPEQNDLRDLDQGSGNTRAQSDYYDRLIKWNKQVKRARHFVKETQEDRELRQKVTIVARKNIHLDTPGVCEDITFASDEMRGLPWKDEDRVVGKKIFKHIELAQERVVIESPYFIMNDRAEKVFGNHLEQGREVSILTNSLHSTDMVFVPAVFNSHAGEWLDKGMNQYLYLGEFPNYAVAIDSARRKARVGTHAKAMVLDDSTLMIGSYNFDQRTNIYTAELAIFCHNNSHLAGALLGNMQKRMERSHMLTLETNLNDQLMKNAPFMQKVAYYLAIAPSKLLEYLQFM